MRAAVVTRAGRGIGAAIARRLSDRGWAVVLVDAPGRRPAGYPVSDQADLERVEATCPGPSLAIAADVADGPGLSAAIEQGRESFGRLDAAVAAAGLVLGGAPVWEISDEVWEANLEVNLGGVLHLARACLPHLLAAGWGRFVAVSSVAGGAGLPRLGAYSAAKHGVIGLVKSLARDLEGTRVTANVVSPGSTRTTALEHSARIYGLEDPAEFGEEVPIKRLIEPSEVAGAVEWLLSEDAGAVTGSVVTVDGGMTA